MNRITIAETRNGWLVIDGDARAMVEFEDILKRSWSFNSLDAVVSCVRSVLKQWRHDRQAREAAGGDDGPDDK